MACVATSSANTSPCATVTSAGGLLKRKRPFDHLFDISLSAKRPCRCSEQYAGEQDDLERSLSSRRASAAFSLARAVFSSNAADENGSSGEDDVDITPTTPENCAMLNSHARGSGLETGARLRRHGSIERPMLFRKILERLQEEVKQIERNRRRSSKGNMERDEQTTTCSRCNSSACDSSKCRLYTFRQLCRVCHKLLKEQEKELHEYYERSLTERLSEQYDCFLTFTQEQLNRRFQNAEAPSYIS